MCWHFRPRTPGGSTATRTPVRKTRMTERRSGLRVSPPRAEDAGVRDEERDEVVQRRAHPRGSGRIAAEDDAALIDQRQERADDQGDRDGAPQVLRLRAVREARSDALHDGRPG